MGSSPTMAMQCEHMGAGAEVFTERALDFHACADGILAAAQARDTAACTECHATYRQNVFGAASHTARTSQEHAPGTPEPAAYRRPARFTLRPPRPMVSPAKACPSTKICGRSSTSARIRWVRKPSSTPARGPTGRCTPT